MKQKTAKQKIALVLIGLLAFGPVGTQVFTAKNVRAEEIGSVSTEKNEVAEDTLGGSVENYALPGGQVTPASSVKDGAPAEAGGAGTSTEAKSGSGGDAAVSGGTQETGDAGFGVTQEENSLGNREEEWRISGNANSGSEKEIEDSEGSENAEDLEEDLAEMPGEELPSDINSAYISTEMDSGAEVAEGIAAEDRSLLLRAAAPAYSPDLNSWLPIRNQNPYGNCWAYAVLALAESDSIRTGRAGSGVDFSELALAYSLFYTPEDPLGGTSGDSTTVLSGDYLNVGGNSFWGLQILSQWWGPVAEGTLTLTVAGALSPAQPSAALLRSDAAHLENMYMINRAANPGMVKDMILQYGAVAGAYWDPAGSSGSSAGVTRDTYYNSDAHAFYYAKNAKGAQNHAITIVGWDDAFPASSFPTDPGMDGAWLVRNSWGGSGMGYSGYFWMSYAEPSLAETVYAADFGDAAKYANNYQYDGGVSNANLSNDTTTLKAANVFTAHAGAVAETVEAVSVGIGSANTTAKVEVYTNLKNAADPTSGTKAAEGSRSLTFTGQYTIPLDTAVKVNRGDTFAVVVTLTNRSSSGGTAKIMRENNAIIGGQVQAACAIQKGQSFVYLNGSWADQVSGGGNLRIKAFTNNAATSAPTPTATSTPTPTPTAAPTPAPTVTPTPAPEVMPSVTYQTHVQTYGWQDWVSDGTTSGTTGQSKRLEGIRIRVNNDTRLGIQYRTHIQTYGWESGWSADGAMSGTSGQSKRLEAIQIRLTGADAEKYDVYYCVHAQHFGWLGWAKNGESAGTAGYAYRLEGIRIRIVKKGSAAPQPLGEHWVEFYEKGTEPQPAKNNTGALVTYNTHVQTYGWQDYVYDGSLAGTTGQSKRLEGIHIRLLNQKYAGDIEYRTHIQTYGWESGWKKNGAMSGTSGQAKRLEAIQIRLTGEMAEHYDVYYQTHIQHFGWSGWAKNGQQCGSAGYAYRLEGIRIRLVLKGGSAPGSTAGTFYTK